MAEEADQRKRTAGKGMTMHLTADHVLRLKARRSEATGTHLSYRGIRGHKQRSDRLQERDSSPGHALKRVTCMWGYPGSMKMSNMKLAVLVAASVAGLLGCSSNPGRIYRDQMYNYEFQYPQTHSLKDISGALLLSGEDSEWFIKIDEISRYPRAEYDVNKVSWEEFAVTVARLMCCADGPDGSRYCEKLVRKETFSNRWKVMIMEFYLLETIETRTSDEVRTEQRQKGPIFAVRLSTPQEPYRILIIMPWDDGAISPMAEATVRKLVHTVRLLR